MPDGDLGGTGMWSNGGSSGNIDIEQTSPATGQPQPVSGCPSAQGGTATSGVQVVCNDMNPGQAGDYDQCMATVGGSAGGGGSSAPTGTVLWEVNSGATGGFPGSTTNCTLAPSSGGNTSYCSVQFTPPTPESQPPILADYLGDTNFAPSSGAPQDLGTPTNTTTTATTTTGSGTATTTDTTTTGTSTATTTDTTTTGTSTTSDTATTTTSTSTTTPGQDSISLDLSPDTVNVCGDSCGLGNTVVAGIEVRDGEGQGVEDQDIKLSASDPDVSFSPVSAEGDGDYSAIVFPSSTIGTVTVTATDDSAAPPVSATATYNQECQAGSAGTDLRRGALSPRDAGSSAVCTKTVLQCIDQGGSAYCNVNVAPSDPADTDRSDVPVNGNVRITAELVFTSGGKTKHYPDTLTANCRLAWALGAPGAALLGVPALAERCRPGGQRRQAAGGSVVLQRHHGLLRWLRQPGHQPIGRDQVLQAVAIGVSLCADQLK